MRDQTRRSVELGLERLGARAEPWSTTLGTSRAPLFDWRRPDYSCALVYTPAEETGPDSVATLETAVAGLFSAHYYSSLLSAAKMLGADVAAVLPEPPVMGPPPALGNIPHSDAVHTRDVHRLLANDPSGTPPLAPAGPLDVLRTSRTTWHATSHGTSFATAFETWRCERIHGDPARYRPT
jgi:hypothetical protein